VAFHRTGLNMEQRPPNKVIIRACGALRARG
jgi:hypothetical protein